MLMKIAENNAKLDYEASKKIKTFTIDAVIETPEQQKIYELENKLKAKEEVEKIILEMKTDISEIKVKLGIKQALAIGALASFIGSVFFAVWTYVGKVITENPEIMNSTKP